MPTEPKNMTVSETKRLIKARQVSVCIDNYNFHEKTLRLIIAKTITEYGPEQ